MSSVSGEVAQRAERTGNRLRLPFAVDLRLGDLVRQTTAQAKQHHLAAFAGNVAYRNLFALLPSLVTLFWVLKLFGASSLLSDVASLAATALPRAAADGVKEQLLNVSGAQAGGTVTTGALATLIVSLAAISTGFHTAMEAMNVIYGVKEHRSFIRRQVLSLLLALAVSALLAGALLLLVFGSRIAEQLGTVHGSGMVLRWLWLLGTWPVIGAAVLAAFALLYYVAPDVQQRFRWISIGSVIGAVLWLLFAALFSLYVNNVIAPTQTYGALAGVAVLMIYFYISSFILLVGAELNQVIEQHDPRGKDGGQRVAGATGAHAG